MNTRTLPLLATAIIVGASLTARGQTSWENAVDGDWDDGSKWSAGVPDNNHAYLTNAAASHAVAVNVAVAPFTHLSMSNAPGQSVVLNVHADMDFGNTDRFESYLRPGSAIHVHDNGGVRTFFQVARGDVTVHDGGQFYLMRNSASFRGVLTVESGGFLQTSLGVGVGTTVLGDGGVLINEAGGTWSQILNNSFRVGSIGSTSAAVVTNRGTATIACDAWIGYDTGSTVYHEFVQESGSVRFSRVGHELRIGEGNGVGGGQDGLGRFRMTGGTTRCDSRLRVGNYRNATGVRTVQGELLIEAGTWDQRDLATIGNAPIHHFHGSPSSGNYDTVAGRLEQSGGLFHTHHDVWVANGPVQGDLTVSGGVFIVTNATASAMLQVSVKENAAHPGRGTLTLDGGQVVVDRLVATNGTDYSTINLLDGTLEIRHVAEVGAGTDFTVGDGTAPARLVLADGAECAVVEGLTVNSQAELVIGGTNSIGAATISGNLALTENARLRWNFDATDADLATVTGTVTLPSALTVELDALDASSPGIIPLISADGGFDGSPAAWPPVEVNGKTYRAVVEGTMLQMQFPRGTMLMLR